MNQTRPAADRQPLALLLAGLLAVYAVAYRFADYNTSAILLWPFGALALYSGARLRTWQAFGLMAAVMAGTDLVFFLTKHRGVSLPTYLSFALFVLLGVLVRPVLRRGWPTAMAGVGATSIIGYALYFLITNTASWLGNALPEYSPHTLQSLLLAYEKGLEFVRGRPGEVFGNPLLAGLVFGAHALLARAYFPAERFRTEAVR